MTRSLSAIYLCACLLFIVQKSANARSAKAIDVETISSKSKEAFSRTVRLEKRLNILGEQISESEARLETLKEELSSLDDRTNKERKKIKVSFRKETSKLERYRSKQDRIERKLAMLVKRKEVKVAKKVLGSDPDVSDFRKESLTETHNNFDLTEVSDAPALVIETEKQLESSSKVVEKRINDLKDSVEQVSNKITDG